MAQPEATVWEVQNLYWNGSIQRGYRILHVGFTVLPMVTGLDKFFGLLTNWDQYLAPSIARFLPMGSHSFMLMVGGIEILAGILVAIRPKWGSRVVALWLWGIIANLLMVPGYFDIALRDFGLSLGALALSSLSVANDQSPATGSPEKLSTRLRRTA